MSDPVWVCEESPGRWTALCCDSRCGYCGIHAVLESSHRPSAEAAATRHRKYLATLPEEYQEPRRDTCARCGQSPGVVQELRELVGALEIELNHLLG